MLYIANMQNLNRNQFVFSVTQEYQNLICFIVNGAYFNITTILGTQLTWELLMLH
jgi:hypothetical protein